MRGRSNVVRKQRASKPLSVVFSRSSHPVHHWSRSMESSPIHGLAGAMIYQRAAAGWPADFSFWTAQPSQAADPSNASQCNGSSCPGSISIQAYCMPTHRLLRKRTYALCRSLMLNELAYADNRINFVSLARWTNNFDIISFPCAVEHACIFVSLEGVQ